MRLIEPTVINPRPGIIVPVLGGFLGTFLITAGMFLAPVIGFPLIDAPLIIGGIFTGDPTIALWIGFWLHILAGSIVFPILFAVLWPILPGPMMGILSDIVKGLAVGLTLWILSGLLMPIVDALNRLGPEFAKPGFFGAAFGAKGVLALFAGHVVYGLSLGLVSYMAADVFPLETLGWQGYLKAELPPGGNLYQDRTFPEYPSLGNR